MRLLGRGCCSSEPLSGVSSPLEEAVVELGAEMRPLSTIEILAIASMGPESVEAQERLADVCGDDAVAEGKEGDAGATELADCLPGPVAAIVR